MQKYNTKASESFFFFLILLNYLNLAKLNVISPNKDNFIQPLSIKDILDAFEISKDHHYRALSVLKDKDVKLHLKWLPKTCFANVYFDVGVKA